MQHNMKFLQNQEELHYAHGGSIECRQKVKNTSIYTPFSSSKYEWMTLISNTII